jgi:hypothetical protein
VVDSQLFSFDFPKLDENEALQELRVQWPWALINGGEISVRDNIGKTLWSRSLDKTELKFVKRKTAEGSAVLAQFSKNVFPIATYQLIKFAPYFRICVQKTEGLSRLSLCSRDLRFQRNTKGQNFLEKETQNQSRPKVSSVNINGREVDRSGVIFLQGADSLLSVRIQLQSGTNVDIDTRMKAIEFRDIFESKDGTSYLITASGAEPATGVTHTRLENNQWQTSIDAKRPVIYLKGEGDIPLRQEFVIKGPVRPRNLIIEAQSDLPTFTYSNSLQISLNKPEGYKLEGFENLSQIEERESDYRWTLSELRDGTTNRRQIKATNGTESIVAAWDLQKAQPWLARVAVGYSGMARGQIERWFDNKILGVGLEFQYYFSGLNSEDKTAQRLRTPLFWSWKKFVNMKDSAWGLILTPVQNSIGVDVTQSVTAGFFAHIAAPSFLSQAGEWLRIESQLISMPLGTPSFDQARMMRIEMLKERGREQQWIWGLEWQEGRMSSTERYSRWFGLHLGLGFSF